MTDPSRHALRWGVLGTGNIASLQVDDLFGNGHVVTAVGSRTAERAREFAARKQIPRAHASYLGLVEDPEVDIVYVATPASAHYDNASLALRAGKHVLLEKPFTVTAEEAEALVKLADQQSCVLLEALWTRFLPHSRHLRETVRSGLIGEVRAIIADTAQLLPVDRGFRLNRPELAGGALLDLGIYPVSLAFDLLGEPESVMAVATMGDSGVDTQTSVVLRYGSGAHVYGHAAINAVGDGRALILGTEGRVELDSIFYTSTSFTVYGPDGEQKDHFTFGEKHRGMQYQAAEIERLILAGEQRSPILPLEESVAMMRVLDAAREQAGIDWGGRV